MKKEDADKFKPNGDCASVEFPPLKRKFFEFVVEESSKAEQYPNEIG